MDNSLIKRQDAIDALCNDYCGGHQDCKYYPNCENLKSIEKLPSARPERKIGEWIKVDPHIVICPFCKHASSSKNFCADCGADLRGGNNE